MPVGAWDAGGAVPDECIVYRVLNDPQHIKETGEAKTSGFSNSSPGEGEAEEDCYMSVVFEDQMTAANKTLADLLVWWKKPAKVARFTAKELRDLGEETARYPIEEFPGHGGVYRKDRKRRTGGQKNDLVRVARILG